jgi:hypothetical protein
VAWCTSIATSPNHGIPSLAMISNPCRGVHPIFTPISLSCFATSFSNSHSTSFLAG